MELTGRPLVGGEAEGDVVWTDEPLSFWGGVDPADGRVVDRHHGLRGRLLAGRVLVLPESRGSSTTSGVLLEAVRAGTAPAALVVTHPDTVLILGAVVARELYGRGPAVALVDGPTFEALRSATRVRLGATGSITLLSGA